ncbi:MAG TPA: S8 family serine peptidase [Lapillicoccus sp.]|nr:S8 family serine peptidase [Lapillicoccus sp.]
MQARETRDALNRGRGSERKRIASQVPPDGAPEYLYVEDVLTTRSADLPAVEAGLQDPDDQALADLLGATSWTPVDNAPIPGVATVTFDGPVDVTEVCRVFDGRIRLGAVMPMGVVHITPTGYCPDSEPVVVPSQPDQSPAPVDVSPDFGEDVSVVVIDTGRRTDVEQAHTWLSSPAITGDPEQNGIEHYTGHGTFVCGVLRSMAPKVAIDVNGVLYALGAADEEDMAQELYEAVFQDRPDIISMSAGTTSRDDLPPITLSVICEQLADQGVLLVAAAGNDGNTEAFYPAFFSVEDPRIGRAANPNVVSVGALTKDGKRADYSNHDWPVIYAQGSEVVNAYPNWTYRYVYPPMKGKPDAVFSNGLASWNGTSFSTPLVSGLIAAHMTVRGETDARTAWEHLLASATPVPSAGPSLKPGSQMANP